MKWFLAAPFITDSSDQWLTPFVPPVQGRSFESVPAAYAHDRSRKITSLGGWRDFFSHGALTWSRARSSAEASGIITCFPQLPIVVGLRKRLQRSQVPILAWTFNLGTLYPGARRALARTALAAVDRIVVHSTAEIESYSEWSGLPRERFRFVPLQRPIRAITVEEEQTDPFVLAMGTAHRDYRLLFDVLAELRYPAVVVSGPHAVAGLTLPPNVRLRSGLTAAQCHELAQRARVNVIPIANRETASGQVTLLEAMMFGRPVVATQCLATVDYARAGEDALLVPQGDAASLLQALRMLWLDKELRERIGRNARATAIARFSDEAIGIEFGRHLQELEAESGAR